MCLIKTDQVQIYHYTHQAFSSSVNPSTAVWMSSSCTSLLFWRLYGWHAWQVLSVIPRNNWWNADCQSAAHFSILCQSISDQPGPQRSQQRCRSRDVRNSFPGRRRTIMFCQYCKHSTLMDVSCNFSPNTDLSHITAAAIHWGELNFYHVSCRHSGRHVSLHDAPVHMTQHRNGSSSIQTSTLLDPRLLTRGAHTFSLLWITSFVVLRKTSEQLLRVEAPLRTQQRPPLFIFTERFTLKRRDLQPSSGSPD